MSFEDNKEIYLHLLNQIEDAAILLNNVGQVEYINLKASKYLKSKNLFLDNISFHQITSFESFEKLRSFYSKKFNYQEVNLMVDGSEQLFDMNFTELFVKGKSCGYLLKVKPNAKEADSELVALKDQAVNEKGHWGYNLSNGQFALDNFLENMLGLPDNSKLGLMAIRRFFQRDNLRELIQSIKTVKGNKNSIQASVKLKNLRGEKFFTTLVIDIVKNTDGHITSCSGTISNENQQNKKVQSMWEMTEYLRASVQNTNNLIIATDKNGIIKLFNHAAETKLGYKSNEIVNKATPFIFSEPKEIFKIFKTIKEQDGVELKPGKDAMRYFSNNSQFKEVERTFIDKHGKRFIGKTSFSVLKDENGEDSGYLMSINDISKQKEFEQRYELATEGASVGIWDWDLQKNKLFISPRLKEIIGLDEESELDNHEFFSKRIHPSDIEAFSRHLNQNMLVQKQIDMKYRFLHFHGFYIWLHIRGKAIWDTEGYPLRICGSIDDITNEVQTLHDLQSAKDQATEALKTRSEFMAKMSHELRTPMNGVLGMAEILEDTNVDETQSEYLSIIKQSGESLITIINDILDFSKMEAEKLELQMEKFDLPQLVSETFNSFKYTADAKELELKLDMPNDLPQHVVSDKGRIKQILVNLIGNAIKFTTSGSVSVTVDAEINDDHQEAYIKFDITDTGIGISEDQINKLFNPFSQGDNSATRKFGGTGLGLAISKSLCKLLKGDISVKSEHGQGSTFNFYIITKLSNNIENININRDNNISGSVTMLADKIPLQILLVEDNIVNQQIASAMLQMFGYTADLAVNGKEAIDKVNEKKYDLIFMDLQMPIMDGYEATENILNKLNLNPPPKIFAMTANVFPEDKKRCFEVGMVEFIGKPVRKIDIESAIEKHFSGRPSENLENIKASEVTAIEKLIDEEALLEQFDDMDDILINIINEFENLNVNYIKEIEDAFAEKDAHKLERSSHALKSAVSNFFATEVTQRLFALESAGRDENFDNVPEMINDMKEHILKLIQELKDISQKLNAA